MYVPSKIRFMLCYRNFEEIFKRLKSNCIGLFIFSCIIDSPYSLEKKELALLVELYESYGPLKTHTTPTH